MTVGVENVAPVIRKVSFAKSRADFLEFVHEALIPFHLLI